MQSQEMQHEIGSLNEKPLHAALKEWYAQPGDQFEVPVDNFVIDIVRDELLIEIQTQGFSQIKGKLAELLARHPVQLVYPIAREKWIVKLTQGRRGRRSRRKSPKRGTIHDVFGELVSIPGLLSEPGFTLEVLLIQEEEVRRHDPKRAWRRRGWVTHERRLLDVVDRKVFREPADLAALIPPELSEPFTTSDLAAAIFRPLRLAQRMAYCLREMGAIVAVGKQGNAFLYARTTEAA